MADIFDEVEADIFDEVAAEETPQRFAVPPSGPTQLRQGKPLREAASRIYTPVLKGLGFGAGLLAGAPAAAASAPTGAGPLVVEGLLAAGGHAAGGRVAQGLDEVLGIRPPQTAGEAFRGTVKDVEEGALGYMGGKVLEKVVPGALQRLLPSKFGEPTSAPVDIDAAIDKGIAKGVKPVSGPKSAALNDNYIRNQRDAVKEIVRRKDQIKLPEGKPVPESVADFSEAIDQTKNLVFQEYDQLVRSAGGQGATVPVDRLAAELRAMRSDRALNESSPGAVQYIDRLLEELGKRGAYTPQDAQRAVAVANESLKSYYASPNADTASRNAVDALRANIIRREIDTALEGANLPGYQGLKNRYGALKSIERDVNHRRNVEARKNPYGFFDATDIYTAGEMLQGILTANPAQIAKSAGARGLKEYMKWRNAPDTNIKEMFSTVAKHYKPPVASVMETTTPYDTLGPRPSVDDEWAASVAGKPSPFRNRQTGYLGETVPQSRSTLPVEGFQGRTEQEVLGDAWRQVQGVVPGPGYIGETIPGARPTSRIALDLNETPAVAAIPQRTTATATPLPSAVDRLGQFRGGTSPVAAMYGITDEAYLAAMKGAPPQTRKLVEKVAEKSQGGTVPVALDQTEKAAIKAIEARIKSSAVNPLAKQAADAEALAKSTNPNYARFGGLPPVPTEFRTVDGTLVKMGRNRAEWSIQKGANEMSIYPGEFRPLSDKNAAQLWNDAYWAGKKRR